ncbi:hypothetical protein [Pedobacter sp. GR22-6]|uniref:hypothetical protein n=1 Tax=Pedobacter sp. GR22-6 TaxID=3127957 RepID=UPI00307D4D0E
MNSIKKYTTLLLMLFVTALTACNKEELNEGKVMHVIVNGYNGSDHELEITLDTTVYKKSIRNGDLLIKARTISTFNRAYVYYTPEAKGQMTVKDLSSGKVVFSRPLPAKDKADFNFIYLDGKELEIPGIAANPGSNKLGFYLHYTESNDPIDIFLYRKDASTGQEYRHYLAKNARPGSWLSVDYVAAADFSTVNAMQAANLYFTKAGTTDQWAFRDNETLSMTSARSQFFPLAGENGLVQSYFITPGINQLDCARLFFYPGRI